MSESSVAETKPQTKLQVGASRCDIPTPKLHPRATRVQWTHRHVPTSGCSSPAWPDSVPSPPACSHREVNLTYSLILTQNVQPLICSSVSFVLAYGSFPVECPLLVPLLLTIAAPSMLTPINHPFLKKRRRSTKLLTCKCAVRSPSALSPPLTNLLILQR